jgi:hypothetical protein
MTRLFHCIALACLLASIPLMSQQNVSSSAAVGTGNEPPAASTRPATSIGPLSPFSRLALGGGIGINGINLQAATNVNPYLNIRAVGNVFGYTVNNISTNGFNANGKLDLGTMGASLDYYPWPKHGFRLSPGALFYNQNSLTASATVLAGQSFTLNHVEYYSSSSDPVQAKAKVGLNATNPSFTMTTGWGNMISRKGGHWSFPFELGAAFVGSPSLKMTLAGTACDATGTICVDAATDPTLQQNLNTQIDKYKSDIDALTVFPILSVGVSYNFSISNSR